MCIHPNVNDIRLKLKLSAKLLIRLVDANRKELNKHYHIYLNLLKTGNSKTILKSLSSHSHHIAGVLSASSFPVSLIITCTDRDGSVSDYYTGVVIYV